MHRDYECPKCGDWIELHTETSGTVFKCPWCNERLRLDADAEFENGIWHDLSKLVTAGSHWDEKI